MDVDLTLVLLMILVPTGIVLGAIVRFARPREEELEVAAAGFVVVRE
jgi:hypothetical protein